MLRTVVHEESYAYASNYPPYVAVYDGKTGDLRIEVSLTEIRRE